MAFPDLSNITALTTDVSDASLDAISLVRSGGAFSNPIANKLTSSLAVTSATKSSILALSPPSGWTAQDITDLGSDLDTMFSGITSFKEHTDRISGVTQPPHGSELPSLQNLLSVGTSYNLWSSSIGDVISGPCGKLITFFGGVFLGEEKLNGLESFLFNLLSLVQAGTSTYAEVSADLLRYKTDIDVIINGDKQFYIDAVADLIDITTGGMLRDMRNDPCARHMLQNVIGTAELGDILNKL